MTNHESPSPADSPACESAFASSPLRGSKPPLTPNHGSYRIAVIASGRGSNFLALQRTAADSGWPITFVGVFSDKRKAPVLEHARSLGIQSQVIPPRGYPDRAAHDAALFAALAAVQPDLIVCAGYMRIIGAAAIESWLGRMINIHPSLLPNYMGLHTHDRALEAGEHEHGASVHFVTAELDGGPVIAQARVPVHPSDDADALAARVLAQEHRLLPAVVHAIAAGRIGWRAGIVLDQGNPLSSPLQLDATGELHPEARL